MAVNRYAQRAHLSEAQIRQLAKLFAFEIDATRASRLTGISRRTVNRYYREFRARIALATEREAARDSDDAELRLAVGPQASALLEPRAGQKAFGIQVRHGHVHTEIVEHAREKRAALRPLERHGSVDARAAYDAIVLLSSPGRSRLVRRRTNGAARRRIDRVESFWSVTKSRLARRRGLDRRYFYLHLKECEFRFNHPHVDVFRALLDMMRREPVK